MAKIKIVNMYRGFGITGHNAWYRKVGDGCFDFVNDKKYATELNEAETKNVMAHADWYCKQYDAEKMEVE